MDLILFSFFSFPFDFCENCRLFCRLLVMASFVVFCPAPSEGEVWGFKKITNFKKILKLQEYISKEKKKNPWKKKIKRRGFTPRTGGMKVAWSALAGRASGGPGKHPRKRSPSPGRYPPRCCRGDPRREQGPLVRPRRGASARAAVTTRLSIPSHAMSTARSLLPCHRFCRRARVGWAARAERGLAGFGAGAAPRVYPTVVVIPLPFPILRFTRKFIVYARMYRRVCTQIYIQSSL